MEIEIVDVQFMLIMETQTIMKHGAKDNVCLLPNLAYIQVQLKGPLHWFSQILHERHFVWSSAILYGYFFFPSGIVVAVLCFSAAVTVSVAFLCCHSKFRCMTLAIAPKNVLEHKNMAINIAPVSASTHPI